MGNISSSKQSKPTISRKRYVINRDDNGLFLKTLENSAPVWTDDPLDAMTYCHEYTVQRNIKALGEYYELPAALSYQAITYSAFTNKPSQWFVDDAAP